VRFLSLEPEASGEGIGTGRMGEILFVPHPVRRKSPSKKANGGRDARNAIIVVSSN
jgi:hypothetical protein